MTKAKRVYKRTQPKGPEPGSPQDRFERSFAEVFGTRTVPDFTPREGQGPGQGAKHRGRR